MGRTPIVRIATLAIACATVWLIALGGTASALGVSGYSEPTSGTETLGVGSTTTIDVPCPAGDVVVGGGYDVSVPSLVTVTESAPASDESLSDDTWEVVAQALRTASNITVTAVCVSSSSVSDYSEPQNAVKVGAGDAGEASTTCASGDVVVGGGFEVPPGVATLGATPTSSSNESPPWSSNESPTTWTVFAYNTSAATESVTSSAICVASSLTGYAEELNQQQVAGGSATTAVTADCPSGELVLGGGYWIEWPTWPTYMQVGAEQPANDDGWTLSVTNSSSLGRAGPWAGSWAICASPVPTVTSVSPTSGPAAGGTPVTIAGSGFTGATAVDFGSTAATAVTVNSDTSITATAPPGSGSAAVSVTTPAGTSTSNVDLHYTYIPSVTAVSPTTGPLSGANSVVVTGIGFTGASAVSFGSTAATTFTVNSATQITATAPAGSAGTVNITVTTSGEQSPANSSDQYTYTRAPTITGVSPTSGDAGGGTVVTITGTGLADATSVRFGSTAASAFTDVSATQIMATSPPGSVGTNDVTVTTSFGTSATGSLDEFTYTTAPAVAAVTAAGLPVVQGAAGAGFSGTVNPEGQPATAYFEYGLDPKYAGGGPIVYTATTPVQQIGAGVSPGSVSASVSGLLPNALYHVRLIAANSAGTTVGPDETFTTAASPAPPPPVLGKTENVTPVSGIVYIKLPVSTTSGGKKTQATITKGKGFIPLTEGRQIPSGSQIDARSGTLDLVAAPATKHGKTEEITLTGAIFSSTQSRTGLTKGLTTLALLEGDFPGAPSYAICAKAAADRAEADTATDSHATDNPAAQAAKASPKVLQTLKASDNHGHFATKGRYSSASVLGTEWTTSDRCDGTLTTVQRGIVAVYDFASRKTITVHAGHSYLAKA